MVIDSSVMNAGMLLVVTEGHFYSILRWNMELKYNNERVRECVRVVKANLEQTKHAVRAARYETPSSDEQTFFTDIIISLEDLEKKL